MTPLPKGEPDYQRRSPTILPPPRRTRVPPPGPSNPAPSKGGMPWWGVLILGLANAALCGWLLWEMVNT